MVQRLRNSPSGPDVSLESLAESTYGFAEDFDVTGSGTINTTGSIFPGGSGNWYAVATSGSGNQSISGLTSGNALLEHPGIVRMLTAATINNGLLLKRGVANSSSNPYLRSEKIDLLTAIVAIPTITSVRVEIGIDSGLETPVVHTEGAMFFFDSSAAGSLSNQWQISASRVSSANAVNQPTGVTLAASNASDATFWKLQIQQPSTSVWQFLINDTIVGEIDRSNVVGNASPVNVGALVQALSGSSRELQMDFYSLRSKLLNRSS